MKKTLFLNKFTVFHKLIFAFLILILPVYFLSFLINHASLNYLRDEIEGSASANMHFYLSSFETEIIRLNNLLNAYLINKDFQDIANKWQIMSDYTKAEAILEVKNKLEILATSSPYVSDVKAYIPSLGRSIFANSYAYTIPEQEIEFLTSNPTESILLNWDSKMLIKGQYPRSIYVQSFVLLLEVELSSDKIRDLLLNMTYEEGSCAAFINVDDNWIFSDNKNDEVIWQLYNELSQDEKSKTSYQAQTRFENGKTQYLAIYEYSSYLNTYFALCIPESQLLKPIRTYNIMLWSISFIAIFVVIIVSYWIFILVRRPMKILVDGLHKVEKGDLDISLTSEKNDEFYYLYNQFNNMVSRLNFLIHENYEMEILNRKAQLKQLQSQINPHFLYNSFLTLKFLAMEGKNKAIINMTKYLEKYFHFLTYNFQDEVTLESEYNHAINYSSLQSIRFSKRIKIKTDQLANHLKNIIVPRLIIQPILENAYNHGLEDKEKDGLIIVSVREDDERITVAVEDNGDSLDDEKLEYIRGMLDISLQEIKDATGMVNVHRRLQLKYGPEYGLIVSRSPLGGLLVEINIAKGA